MAHSSLSFLAFLLQIMRIFEYPIIFILLAASTGRSVPGCFDSIVSFGDSLADTGNLLRLRPADNLPRSARLPYGRTYFNRPTGRFSDGRLVVDFIAQILGLPLLQPYVGAEGGGRNFSEGVNFAVAGATALDNGIFEGMGFHDPETNVSLGTQLDWFEQFLATIPDGGKFLERSLVLLGEIGGNDYNYPIMQGANIETLQSFVPPVVNYIGSILEEVINLGAKTILAPGNFPIGCLPVYLTQFQESSAPSDYDSETGCLSWLNELSRLHNELLQKELSRIRGLHPHVTLIYGDNYNVVARMYLSPKEFGFTEGILGACCGVEGPYNYDGSARCGLPPSTSCKDPSSFASWDGIHFTEATNRLIAQGLLEGLYTIPCISSICPVVSSAENRVDE